MLSNDKGGEGSWQIAEQLENYIPAEEGKEERDVKDKTAADELKPEIHTGEKVDIILNVTNHSSDSIEVKLQT